ncbi:MAG: hypothetical protein AB7D33_16015 [Sphingobium sp.]
MQTLRNDNFTPSGTHRKGRADRRLETIVSRLSRTGGYVALALGIAGVVLLLDLIF